MSCPIARPLNAMICIVLLITAAFPASAQGQTPTTPQERPDSPTLRPSPTQLRLQMEAQERAAAERQTTDTTTQDQPTSTRPTSGRTTPTPPTPRDTSDARPTARQTPQRDTPDAPPAAARTGAAEAAAADRGPGRDPAAAARASAAPRPVVGGGAAGGGTAFTRGAIGSVSATGTGAFEPIMDREPEYGDLPEGGDLLTLEGPMPIMEFLTIIYMATGWDMLISPYLEDMQLRFWLSEKTPREALEVLRFNKVYYEFDEETSFLRVMSQEEYLDREFGKKNPHEFKVSHADVTYIESMVNSLLSSGGRVITDQRTNNIYVWDTDDNIQEMVRIVSDLDVPLQKAEFFIEYADLPDIETVLATFMSPSGSILSDVRTGQIFVWDAPSVLDQMRLAVSRLDQPVESHTFYIVHVNAEDVLDSIEPMLTERGLIQMDPRFNTLVVTDLPARVAKIAGIIETLDQPLETRTWVLKYADLDFVADQIEMYIPGEMGQIVIQDEVHQITVTGLPERLDEIDALIQVWDVKRRQVLIEAHVVEVGSEVERAFNVNWSYFANIGGAPFSLHSGAGATGAPSASGSGQIMGGGGQPYAVPRYGALQLDNAGNIMRPALQDISGSAIMDRYHGRNIAATLEYLDQQNKATILSSPRVTVQDSEEAVFENATRVPYVSATSGYGSSYLPPTGTTGAQDYRYRPSTGSRVEFIDVGTILSVFPRITADDNILLDINAEDSTFTDKTIVVDDLTRTVPEKTVRRAQTQVRIDSGGTIVLGGLRRDRTSHSTTRTPILGDLPVVGRLFRNPRRTSEHNTLLIFITTSIVDESTMPESVKIARADSEIAAAYRKAQKGALGRLRDHLAGDDHEIGVAIGQNGHIHCRGENLSIDELRDLFFDASGSVPVTVVVRKHPHADIAIVNAVTETAMEAGLRIEFDEDITPIVPAL